MKAINAVKSEKISIRSASKRFGVPPSTLYAKVKGDIDKKKRRGPTPFLTQKEERSIVDWIIECSKRGQPRTPIDVRFAAKGILDKFPRPTPFKDNIPSHHWYLQFVKRHHTIKARKPEALSVASSHISEQDLRGWWNQINNYFQESSLLALFNDRNRIANCDESMFQFNCNPGKVLVEKSSKNSYLAQVGGNKTGCTVLHTVS